MEGSVNKHHEDREPILPIHSSFLEPSVIAKLYPNSHAICTDQFLNISQDSYPLPWLLREIIQNFVDANPGEDKGSLNNVEITHEIEKEITTQRKLIALLSQKKSGEGDVHSSGKHHFSIRGQWAFKDPTGLISLHSGKADPNESPNAGGNGIGIKQTILRLLRDYNVECFTVQGEEWEVNYRLIDKKESNELAQEKLEDPSEIKHNWLIATVSRSDKKGSNCYELATDNSEVIEAFSDIHNMGVGPDNEYLMNPDISNEAGVLKWLLPDVHSKQPARGRFFVNGQVMSYKESRKGGSSDYWSGPFGVTLAAHNTRYQISIDRPPANDDDLERNAMNILDPLSIDELIDQLRQTEVFWMDCDIYYNSWNSLPGHLAVLKALTRTLRYKNIESKKYFTYEDLKEYYPDKTFMHLDKELDSEDRKIIQEENITLCPMFFDQLGVPAVSRLLKSKKKKERELPSANRAERTIINALKESGASVGYENIGDLLKKKNWEKIVSFLAPRIESLEVNHDEQKIIIQLSNEISEEILFNDLLQPNQKNPNQMMVYFLRSLAAHGLSHKAFDLVIGQKDYLETFKLTQDSLENERLLAKNMDQPSDSHGYIEIAFDDSKINQAHWKLFSILSPCKNPQDQKEHAKKMKGLEKAEKKERKKKEREEKREQKAQAREAKMAKREDPSSRDFSKVIDSFGKFGTYAIALLLAMVLAYSTSQIEFEIGDWRGAIENILESSSDDSDTSDSNQRRIIKGYKTPKNPFTRSNRSLSDLVNRNNESDIDSIFDIGSEIKKLFAPRPKIEHFDVNPIENPQARQLSQLTLIRNYFEITTGYPVTNDLFIYDGKGTKGVNFGGSSIAMHQALFDVGFYEMLSVFSHEVAHNLVPNHGPDFAHAEEAIFHAMIDRIDDIALKAINGEPVTEAEKYLVHAPSEWERLKTLKE